MSIRTFVFIESTSGEKCFIRAKDVAAAEERMKSRFGDQWWSTWRWVGAPRSVSIG